MQGSPAKPVSRVQVQISLTTSKQKFHIFRPVKICRPNQGSPPVEIITYIKVDMITLQYPPDPLQPRLMSRDLEDGGEQGSVAHFVPDVDVLGLSRVELCVEGGVGGVTTLQYSPVQHCVPTPGSIIGSAHYSGSRDMSMMSKQVCALSIHKKL